MKRTIQTMVVQIENEEGEHPRVVLQCPEGEFLEPKSSLKTKAIFLDQEPFWSPLQTALKCLEKVNLASSLATP